jgi:hypothetical protein
MKEISLADYQKIKADAEKLERLGIKPFTAPKHLWMQMVMKVHRRNTKFQGMTGVNWQRLIK